MKIDGRNLVLRSIQYTEYRTIPGVVRGATFVRVVPSGIWQGTAPTGDHDCILKQSATKNYTLTLLLVPGGERPCLGSSCAILVFFYPYIGMHVLPILRSMIRVPLPSRVCSDGGPGDPAEFRIGRVLRQEEHVWPQHFSLAGLLHKQEATQYRR